MIRRESQQNGFVEAFIYIPQSETVLDRIDRCIDWKPIRRKIEKLYCQSGPGRPAFPAVTLFKTLLLQGRIYKFRRCRYWTLGRNRCHIYVLCTCYNLKRAVKLRAA